MFLNKNDMLFRVDFKLEVPPPINKISTHAYKGFEKLGRKR